MSSRAYAANWHNKRRVRPLALGVSITLGLFIALAAFYYWPTVDQVRKLFQGVPARSEVILTDARNVTSGASVANILQHDGEVRGALWSKDENRVLTWSADHTARVWDARTGGQLGSVFKQDAAVNGALWSKDGRRILT